MLLWLTAFDEIATIIVGTPASEYGSLDVLGRRKLVDSVVGLHFLVNVVKTVKSGFTILPSQKFIRHVLSFLMLSSIRSNQPLC